MARSERRRSERLSLRGHIDRDSPLPGHPYYNERAARFARRLLYRLFLTPYSVQATRPSSDESSDDHPVNTDVIYRFDDLNRDGFHVLCQKPFWYITFARCKGLSNIHPRLDFRELVDHAPYGFQFLTTIYFTRTGLTDELLEYAHLEVTVNLKKLTVAGNKLTRFPLSLVNQLVNLVEFNASNNKRLDLQADDACLRAPVRSHPALQVSVFLCIDARRQLRRSEWFRVHHSKTYGRFWGGGQDFLPLISAIFDFFTPWNRRSREAFWV